MKLLIFSPIHNNPNDSDYRICLLGIQISDVTIGVIVDFNWGDK